jgi:hypothetical protein
LTPDNEVTRRVQNLVEERRKLVEEKTAVRRQAFFPVNDN